MTILRLTSAALLAAGIGFAGAASAAPANLPSDPQATQRDDSAVTPVWHYGYRHYGYYSPYYYDYGPRYYYRPYYYYGHPYYYGPQFNFGFTIR